MSRPRDFGHFTGALPCLEELRRKMSELSAKLRAVWCLKTLGDFNVLHRRHILTCDSTVKILRFEQLVSMYCISMYFPCPCQLVKCIKHFKAKAAVGAASSESDVSPSRRHLTSTTLCSFVDLCCNAVVSPNLRRFHLIFNDDSLPMNMEDWLLIHNHFTYFETLPVTS